MIAALAMAGAGRGQGGVAGASLPVATTTEDFFFPGSQPDPTGGEIAPIQAAANCEFCHAYFEGFADVQAEPYRNWVASMMGQATRDPIFWACVTVANQDLNDAGSACLRCHTPAGWLGGRSTPADGSALLAGTADFDGVTCHFCHRAVDQDYEAGVSPIEDVSILDDLAKQGLLPYQQHGGNYIVDPEDVRRGPRSPDLLPYNPHGLPPIIESPLHQSSEMCATCHEVSNPAFMRQKDGSYALTALDAPHPTGDKFDMFPFERTYSEWAQSDFANGGVDLGGLFGGEHPTGIMQSCQDCHMPRRVGPGCGLEGFPVFDDMPQHSFSGANSWVIRAVYEQFSFESGLTPEFVDEAVARNIQMLRDASSLDLTQEDSQIKVRITNYSGHKLPTGYPEGRRMWINVRFLDDQGELIEERGAYDPETAALVTGDTKVYEGKLGLDDAMAAATGLPEGESFHFALNNVWLKDNRIPPIGFTNAGFESVQAAPVGYSYADGQHWDDTFYDIPRGAAQAVVTVYHQTTTREYIEFLRDENVTDSRGQEAYDLWVQFGKSPPVDMDSAVIDLSPNVIGDLTGDGIVNGIDLGILLANWSIPPSAPGCRGAIPCPSDLTGDGIVNGIDLGILLANWTF